MNQESKIEKRNYPVEIIADKEKRNVTGHAAVYNSYSVDMGGWREVINSGAFTNAIRTSEVVALFNHNTDQLLGRTSSGTLKLSEDSKGLFYDLQMPESRADLIELIERGDLTKNSFAFTVKTAAWEMRDGIETRVISEIDKLYDVSLVTTPAYQDTSLALRSLKEFRGARASEKKEVNYSEYENQIILQKHTF